MTYTYAEHALALYFAGCLWWENGLSVAEGPQREHTAHNQSLRLVAFEKTGALDSLR